MVSTFHGLETSKRGMFTQQAALGVTGQNIANANTPGYSRQRVNFESTDPYPAPSRNRPQMPGQIGTGVEAGSIERVRDSFLDVQFRNEQNKQGYWETKANALLQMEEVLNEPSDSGLAKTMDLFWQSIQDLAVNPKNPGARAVVREQGIALSDTFQYLSKSLSSMREDIGSEIKITEDEVNSLLQQINNVNNQIVATEVHGNLPNDLYDERDLLIDKLSELVDVKVSYKPTGGNAQAKAEGTAVIDLVGPNDTPISNLVDEKGYQKIKVNVSTENGTSYVTGVSVDGENVEFTSEGKLMGLIESYGVSDAGGVSGTYPDMLAQLDNLAFTFAVEFNKVHYNGMSPNEIKDGVNTNIPFFQDASQESILTTDTNGNLIANEAIRKGFATRIEISDDIRSSLDNIANAEAENPENATTGDATTLLKLADLVNEDFDYGLNSEKANFRNYYEVLIGGMAVDTQNAIRLSENSQTLKTAVDERRMSTSSVSLDEEMTNMIQFQHAYNASARMISLQDELLDRIINGMGAGR
ncbi:flagellar hook-associated protein FlgK [Metabacillus halosaccharovorans]|uniref:flagellar hook-associated protein FlgK n=1 Tax=Metabacillus halosaccharovorans TaxID=930124 RepID=UPI0020413090|nr:flagellar hook-associated protein FlgK [Metabacillus halosaccharovorans]MCM3443757.1 flagellar hook-associated protein FlgK [Metabacillus halosaccharovorans]